MDPEISEWLSCPNCGFNDFDEDCSSDGIVSCPKCDNKIELKVSNSPEIASSEELAKVAGISVDEWEERYTRNKREPEANDSEEVTDSDIEFIKDEEYYRAGGVEFICPECSSKCKMSCSAFGLSDVAYCQSCSYEYRRSREPLVDDLSDGIVLEKKNTEREQYEEYDCEHCEDSHQYSKPDGEYSRPEGKIHSLEEVSVSCPCGERIHFNNVKPNEIRDCSNCQRSYFLNMTNRQS